MLRESSSRLLGLHRCFLKVNDLTVKSIKMSSKVQVTPIGPQLSLGEGPHWDEKTKTLYYVDIVESAIHRYVPHKNEHSHCKLKGKTVSFVVPVEGKEDSEFVVGLERDVVHVVWDLKSNKPTATKVLCSAEEDRGRNRLNDGKVDPTGRLWAGTMLHLGEVDNYPFSSHLYSFDKGSKPKRHLSEIAISNGLAWSPDHTKFYYIDSFKFKVQAYDYDKSSGTISNERTVFDFKANNVEGFPDGMTIDSEGKLWVAVYSGAKVIRVDPDTGKLLYTLPIPSWEVTSVVFGGPNLDELYVTSANQFKNNPKDKYPQPGQTFKVTNLGVKGTPSVSIKLN
ncbi:unnamed protein product [Bemisia tabaci]|uniref:Regucalcin n=2 Tax=Bemisia tabaci TaxID=7038 RepID=A0A9P0AGF3_BEMTA|nr:unnamed protein product [Bemisia tabaci]